MNTAIVVLLILLAVGIVLSPLIRMKAWLQKSPPAQELPPPPDDEPE
jgi:hypothetical protein